MKTQSKTIKKQKIKKPRISRAHIATVDTKYIGQEPIIIGKIESSTDPRYIEALNWYNYVCDQDQAREYLIDYLRQNYSKNDVAAIRRVPKNFIPSTIGWMSRIMMNGAILSDSSMQYFNSKIHNLVTRGELESSIDDTAKIETAVSSVLERTATKNNSIHAECESVIDERGSIYDFLTSNEVTANAAQFLKNKYLPVYNEVMSDDTDVKEAYGKKLKAERIYWQSVIDDLDRFLGNKKVVKIRKPRQKKQKPLTDLIKKLQYQKEFPALKIVSVNPLELIGAQQVWTYNTKYRKLARYDAAGPGGIQVKGTTLIGYNVETSIVKNVRKPEETLNRLLSAGKITLRKFMSELKTNELPANGRINTDTVIIKVIK